MRRSAVLLGVISGVVALSSALAAQGTLAGKVVRDSVGTPVEGAQVMIESLGRSATSGTDGSFRLGGIPAGKHTVIARRLGFAAQIDTVTIASGQTVERRFVLAVRATTLDTARTTADGRHLSPAMRGFEERRKEGFGHFIDDSTLRKNEGRPLTTLLPTYVPGIAITRGQGGNQYLASTRRVNSGRAFGGRGGTSNFQCFATIYRDGVLIYSRKMEGNADTSVQSAVRVNMNQFAADDFAGIEFYAGGATFPAWVSPTDNECGVLILWSREK